MSRNENQREHPGIEEFLLREKDLVDTDVAGVLTLVLSAETAKGTKSTAANTLSKGNVVR